MRLKTTTASRHHGHLQAKMAAVTWHRHRTAMAEGQLIPDPVLPRTGRGETWRSGGSGKQRWATGRRPLPSANLLVHSWKKVMPVFLVSLSLHLRSVHFFFYRVCLLLPFTPRAISLSVPRSVLFSFFFFLSLFLFVSKFVLILYLVVSSTHTSVNPVFHVVIYRWDHGVFYLINYFFRPNLPVNARWIDFFSIHFILSSLP